MQIKPLLHNDVVIVKLDPFPGSPEGRAAGKDDFYGTGIIRPDIAEERPIWGTVLGVGGGREIIMAGHRRFKRTTVRPGDRVLVPYCVGQEFTPSGPDGDGPKCIMVREHGPDGDGRNGILAVEEAA